MKTFLFLSIILLCTNYRPLSGQIPGGEYRYLKSPTTGEYLEVYKQSWALIIGIDKYQNVNRLDYAVADARAIKNLLITKFGFQEDKIRLLTDDGATKENIEQAFNALRKVGSGDRVVVFIAGHGKTVDLPAGGEMGFIIPVDGKINSDGLFLTCIPMSTIKQVSDLIPAKHVLFLIDACYGGLAATITHSALDPSEIDYIDKISRNRARQIITAGGRGEQVIEKSEWGHSAFTKKLLEGLGDYAADLDKNNVIYASELAMYLQKRVSLMTENRQTPKFRYLSDDEGEFMFILPNAGKVVASEIRYGEIYVNSLPDSGAEIFIDGHSTNLRTPTQLSRIESGIHTIELKKGIYIAKQTFTVLPEQPTELTLNLELGKSTLAISSIPITADIYLDGILIGKTPFNPEVRAGAHKIRISKTGYLTDSSEVTLLVEEKKSIELKLTRACMIEINSEPPNADVYIDSKKLQFQSPLTIPELMPGVHQLKIKYSDDYEEWAQDIKLNEGDKREIRAKLRYRYGFLNIQRDPVGTETYLDGKIISPDSMSSYRVLTGSHTIEFKDPSTKRLQNIKILAEPKRAQTIDVKFDIFSSSALFRSAIIPGWGQWNAGSKLKGSGFFLGTAGAVTFLVIEQGKFIRQRNNYNNSKESYLKAVSINDALYWGGQMRSTYSDIEKINRIKNVALVAASVVYGLNIADVLINHSRKDEISIFSGKSQVSFIPEIKSSIDGLAMGIRINF